MTLGPLCSQVVVSGNYNYSDPVIQAQVENLTQTLENSTYISSTLYTESWLRSFIGYVSRNQDYLNATIDNEADFISSLKEVRRRLKSACPFCSAFLIILFFLAICIGSYLSLFFCSQCAFLCSFGCSRQTHSLWMSSSTMKATRSSRHASSSRPSMFRTATRRKTWSSPSERSVMSHRSTRASSTHTSFSSIRYASGVLPDELPTIPAMAPAPAYRYFQLPM